MSQLFFARTTRAALLLAALLAAQGCAPDAELPAATPAEGSAAPAPDTGAVAAPEDVKVDAPNSDAGVDAEDILSLDATGGARTQGTLGITSFSYCNTDLDCPNGMGSCQTSLTLNRIAAGGSAITVAIKTLPGFGVIPANKAGVCSLGCTDHPEVCSVGLRVGADTTPWSCQLVYAGASPYPASGLPFSPNTAELAAGPAYGSLCRPPFERAAAYTPDFCDSCSASDKCENSSACIDDAFYSDEAADQRTGHCLVACNATAANACPTGFACRLPGTGESQLGTPKEGTFCFPTVGSCTSCLDRDGDGVGVGGCNAAGASSAVDCNDTDAEIYFDGAEPDHAFPGSCGANLDANCNGLSDDKEQIGVTDADGNLIYGAEHCGGCFNACGGSEGVGEAASRRACEVTGQGGAFGNLSACRPSCDYPDLRADCSTSATAGDGCETQIDGRASLSIRDCDSDGHGDALATASDLLFDCDGLGVTAVNPRDGRSCATVRVLRGTGPYGDDCDDTQNCVNPGKTEVCDGYDNDCDGHGDESVVGVGQACTVDASNVTVLGACRNGFRTCGSGTEGLICGASLPTAESCDGIDNDCDGITDDVASGALLSDATGAMRVIGEACNVAGALGVCARGSWRCASGGVACVAPAPSATDIFNDPGLLDTNCDGVDGLLAEAIFVKAGGATSVTGSTGSIASIPFGSRALGTMNNPVGNLELAFEIIAARSSTSATKIRQIHIAGSQEAYAMPYGLTLGAADANFAMIGGYEVVLTSAVSGGVTITAATWTAGTAGTQLTLDGSIAFGDNGCGQNDTVCSNPEDDVEAAITVNSPENIVLRRLNLVVTAPPMGFGPVAGIKCSISGVGQCAGLILDQVGLRMDGGAQGELGVDGANFDAVAAQGSSATAPVSGAQGAPGCRGQGSGGPGGVGASAPLSRRSGYSAPDFAYGSGGGGQLSQSETVMFGQPGFVPRDPAYGALGGLAASVNYAMTLFESGPGSTGRSGGGGGGGAGWKNRGGGGGGAGGCGGEGGSAGGAGGSVFGMVILDAFTLPTTSAVTIEVTAAGSGGGGGYGGAGQQGGAQNKSPISFTTPFLDAATWTANGGNSDWFAAGGAGGSGAGGGGGAGGPGGWAVGIAKNSDLAIPDSLTVSVRSGGMGGVGGVGGMGGVIPVGVGGSMPVMGKIGGTGAAGGTLSACALGIAPTGEVACAAPSLLGLGQLCQLDRECSSGRCATGSDGSVNDRCAPAGMNYLPAGTFYMGSYAGEPAHQLDEVHHRVALTKPFFLDATEVTQATWREVSGGTNPSCYQTAGSATCGSGSSASESPVENLDFYAALGFANARSAAEGLSACYALLGCEAAGSAPASVAASAPFCDTGYTYTAPVAAVTAVAASCIQTATPTGTSCAVGFTYVAATTGGSAAICRKTATPAASAPFCADGFVYTAPVAAVAAVAASCTKETGAWRDGSYTCTGYSQVADCTGYRLPTEAEWEYAARAGSTDARYWGNSYNGDYLWEKSNTASSAYTRAVGTALPNAFGLYDMLGNVGELVADGYAKLYPSGAIDPLVSGSNVSLFRINRGGSINDTGVYVYGRPHAATVTTRSQYVGLRLARTVSLGGAGLAVAASVCPTGFHLEGGSCTSDVRACVATHGSGIQTYGTLGWSGATCVAQLCDNGFEVIGNSCKASYGTLCSSDLECAAGYCASAADGTDNDRCAPTGMVTIPRGSFVKKVSNTTPGTVTFAISRSFFMDETETTQQAWKSLSGGTNPSCIQNPPNGTNPGWACTTTNNFDAGPVERVDWYAAMAYANARSASEGLQECYSLIGCPASSTDSVGWRDGAYACTGVEGTYASLSCTGYRLPTEMEWEYAARAGNAAEPNGAAINYGYGLTSNYPDPTSTSYWTATTSAGRTQAVKTKPATASSTSAAVSATPNRWGLYDMAGNVFEMVEDYEELSSPYWPQADKTDYQGRLTVGEVVLKGGSNHPAWPFSNTGSWNFTGTNVTNGHAFNAAYRGWAARSQTNSDVGFRLVRSVVQAPAGGDCGAGFHLDVASNTCEADSKACISSGTAGFSAWDGDSWGTCQKCQAGFVAEPAISSVTTALTGVASSTPTACVPVADQPRTGEGTLCSTNGVVTNGTATPLAGDVSGRLDFTTTTGALTGSSTDSSFGFRDSSIPIATRSDKFSVTLAAGQTLFAKASSTGLRGAADRFVPVLYLFGDDPEAAGSQCNRLATASGNASAIDVTGADGGGALATSESEAIIRFRAPNDLVTPKIYYLIVTSTEPVSATSLPYNLVVNTGKELGDSCSVDGDCASRSCSLGDVSNNSGIGTIGPLPGTGVWPALPTALRVCTPTPDSAWPTPMTWPTGTSDSRSDMVLIPAGTFIMGSPGTEKWRTFTTSGALAEESQHRVTISRPFYLQRLEMTQGAWARVTGSTRNSDNLGAYPLIETDYYGAIGFANELSRREGLTECYNVTCQSTLMNSWIDGAYGPTECSAVALTSASCTGYRLPTESEWEYAARAGTKSAVYYDPNGDGQAENVALNSVASWGIGGGWGQAQPGGRVAPNAWGLYDMIGNNWELVHDSYAAYPTSANSTDPGLASPASKAAIIRGGSYADANTWNRAAARYNWSGNGSLGDARSNYTNPNVGFRLARTAITPISAGTTCAAGYHAAGTICDVDQIACYLDNATAAKQTWNGSAFGDCTATACATGFHVEEGACLSDTKTCSNASGTGLQKWTSGTTYGSCLQPLGGLCAASTDCDGNAQNLAYCPAATAGLPTRRCAPTGMIYLPPATYTAGSPNNEAWSEADENQYQATISRGLFIGTTEVTQAQWKALSNNINPSCFQTTTGTGCTTSTPTSNNDGGPVERVDWMSAAAFANARSIAEGLTPCYERRHYDNANNAYDADWRDGDSQQVISLATIACDGYRLATDAEWEYAARGGTRGPAYNVPNGSASAAQVNLNAISWNTSNAVGAEARTHAVALKTPNAFGLYDMLGNVFEWGHDTGSANPTTPQTDPIEHTTWGGYHSLRGAGYSRGNTNGLRIADLIYNFDWTYADHTTGLRLVRTPVLTALRGLCPSGYHVSGTLCEPDLLACATTATNAVGTAKSWNAVTNSFGACLPYTCATGFHLEGGACLSNSKTCTVSGQTGVQDWTSGTSYSSCKLPLGALCTTDADCASTTLAPTYCATGPTGTANARCAPAGMNFIPAGSFIMGSPAAETYRVADEVQHQVTLTRPFFMGAKEVTQAEWTRLSGDYNPSCFQSTTGAACAGGNLNPTGPVERVDWYAAVGYANARSESEGLTPCYSYSVTRSEAWVEGDHVFGLATPPGSYLPTLNCTGYRLPTEAEWEYAARAGTTGVIYNAANPLAATQAELNAIAWNAGNAGGRTQAVGTRQANAWGLFDMLGNVYEYQWDVYAAYPTTAVTDPLGAVNGWRGIKGRGYTDTLNGYAMRAAMRYNWDPANGNGNTNIGLRLVRTAVLPVAQAGSAALGVAEAACPTGYHVNTADKVCSPDTIACSLEFASSAIQTWNGAAYGDCSVVTCDAQSIQSGSVCTGACSAIGAAATMTAAQTVTGALATTDSANSVRGQGYYFDKYAITLTAGQRVRIALTATGGFSDTYLYVAGGSTCGILAADDDSLGNYNSVIFFTAPAAGTYYLHATSYNGGALGGYSLVTSAW